MANPPKRKGDKAELEAAELINTHLRARGITCSCQRALGAGRQQDTGDIFGLRDHSIQVANWADTSPAAMKKPIEAMQQMANAKARSSAAWLEHSVPVRRRDIRSRVIRPAHDPPSTITKQSPPDSIRTLGEATERRNVSADAHGTPMARAPAQLGELIRETSGFVFENHRRPLCGARHLATVERGFAVE